MNEGNVVPACDRRGMDHVSDAQKLESVLIFEAAAEDHDQRCSGGSECRNRDWHIRNDYIRRAARARVEELQMLLAAAESVMRAQR